MAASSAALIVIPSSINIDETFSVPSIVRPGETISSTGLTSRPGGKGANVSSAIALAGSDAWFVGNVGTDAQWPLEELRQRGVKTDLAGVLDDLPTGRAFIQIAQDGENSIVLLKGANYPTSSPSPSQTFASLPRRPTHLVLQNEIPLSTTAAYLAHAHEIGITTVWNPSPLPTADELRKWRWDQLDVLIVNQGEARDLISSISPKQLNDEQSAERILEELANLDHFSELTWIVVTCGAQGALASVLLQGASPGHRSTVSLPASKPRQVLDTTGAGDTFAGYLVASLAEAYEANKLTGTSKRPGSLDEVRTCLLTSGVAAAMAVEVQGAMESIPNRVDVERRLEEMRR